MTKPNQLKLLELLPEILDGYAAGMTDTMLARKFNVSTRTLRNYLRRSLAGDPTMICTWNEIEAQFWEHIKAAHGIYAYYLDQQNRSDVLLGELQPLIYKGQVSYVYIEGAENETPDMREVLGFQRDGILRDEFGEKVIERVRMPVPAALKIKVLESILPKTYAKIQTIEHKHEAIIRIGGASPEQVEDKQPMKTIEHSPRDLVAPAESPEQVETAVQKPTMMVATPARDAAEWEAWADAGAFDAKPVTLRKSDGSATVFEPGQEPREEIAESLSRDRQHEPGYIIDPVYGKIRADQKAVFDKLRASTPVDAVKAPSGFLSEPHNDPPEKAGGVAVESKPAPPVAASGGTVDPVTGVVTPHAAPAAEAVAPVAYDWGSHPAVIEARNKYSQGQALTAIERQLLAGNFDPLKSYAADDGIGEGGPNLKKMRADGDPRRVAATVTTRPDGVRRVVV